MALDKSAEHGYRCIEFAYLMPDLFDLDRLARRSRELDVQISVTRGVPRDKYVSSQDPDAVKATVGRLMSTLAGARVRLFLFWQHLPAADDFADAPLDPEALLNWRVERSLSAYHAACNP